MNKGLITVFSFVLVLISGCANLSFSEPRTVVGKKLFEKKCVTCHPLPDMIMFNSEGEVKRTVQMMQKEKPSNISDEEAGYIIDYIMSEKKF